MEKVHLLRVRGTVQGVGFRPFVWRLAREMGARGTVLNDNDGVLISLAGVDPCMFEGRLLAEAPRAAKISGIEHSVAEGDYAGFEIVESAVSRGSTEISPDLATCPDCLAETLATVGRRTGYAFTNCTHCGPRFSIIEQLPYDRASTTMRGFHMCDTCAAEYGNPADRRFHAQPIACPVCGPKVWLERDGAVIAMDDAVAAAAVLLKQGHVVAIKGLGGFHLACDALNESAVQHLRRSKGRSRKPLAMMARDLAQISRHAEVGAEEQALLISAAAPIVLLQARGAALAPSVVLGLDRLGFMLPYTPLHHLLMMQLDGPIVLTSANVSDEPQVADNDDARLNLAPLAQAMLMHDRPIAHQIDDSVVRRTASGSILMRRARGFAPAPVRLHESFAGAPSILAMGADLKATIALLQDGKATVSHHMGDLATPLTRAAYGKSLDIFLSLANAKPRAVAVDLHPEFFGTRTGQAISIERELPVIQIQHHHAHIASVMVENGWPLDGPPVLGLALDGVGLGTDGTLWGGEILKCTFQGFERLAHLKPLVLVGADASARRPWRCLASVLAQAGVDPGRLADEVNLTRAARDMLGKFPQALAARKLAVASSSLGRLFDAFAALVGLCVEMQDYEGEAPLLLETAAMRIDDDACFEIQGLDFAPAFLEAMKQKRMGASVEALARRFHNTIIQAFSRQAVGLCSHHGVSAVGLSGGCFHNAILIEGLYSELSRAGLRVMIHREVSPGDGGISLGQAIVGAARIISNARP